MGLLHFGTASGSHSEPPAVSASGTLAGPASSATGTDSAVAAANSMAYERRHNTTTHTARVHSGVPHTSDKLHVQWVYDAEGAASAKSPHSSASSSSSLPASVTEEEEGPTSTTLHKSEAASVDLERVEGAAAGGAGAGCCAMV